MINYCKYIAASLMSAGAFISAGAQVSWDTFSDTWVAVDELGRKVAIAGDGVDRTEIDTDVSIGMFYYLWHGYHNQWDKSVTELLDENIDDPQWGPEGTFHWGSKPWLGYYKGGDRYIVAKHMQMLMDAGVDFLFLDVTNAYWYPASVRAVMAEIDRRTALGLKTPKLAFTLHSKAPATIEGVYATFYSNKGNDKYWYYYDGKPLILADKNDMEGVSSEILDFFTFRNSWAWMEGRNPDEWPWLEFYPQAPGWTYDGTEKKVEQISVSVAQHAHSKIGKSYHNGQEPAFYGLGVCEETPYGLYFQEQWDRALEVHAPIVMVTQFNEWIAQRFIIKNEVELGYVRPGAYGSMGETYFVDVYNAEFSRDLEPSAHPLVRDNYYLQLVSNIRRYRGAHSIPEPTVNLSININGSFDQWDAESLEFRDDKHDSDITSADAQTPSTLKRATNDIVTAKVTQDADNIYFYVSTTDNISSPATSDLWMRLFLNTDTDYSTGWGGYDYCVYKDADTGVYSLMKHDGDFHWRTIAPVSYRIENNKMHLAIQRSDLGIDASQDIDFKWTDNISDDNPDIMSFISDGDVAPNGRFNYRYKGTAVTSGIDDISDDVIPSHLSIIATGNKVNISNTSSDSMDIAIYDTTGRKCYDTCIEALQSTELSLSNGVYVVRYSTKGFSGSNKFICH